ncbi:response regulator transcription factor [Pirellulaceae bacterium SH449]
MDSKPLDPAVQVDPALQVAVLIVDNDKKAQKSIFDLVSRQGISCQVFETASLFRQLVVEEPVGCMFIGSELDDMPGIDLMRHLKDMGWNVPTIITAGLGSVQSCSDAFLSGALAYLEKPFAPNQLEDSLSRAIAVSQQKKLNDDRRNKAVSLLANLTQREKEVVSRIVQGLPIKSIAALFGTSFQAVARHRQRILDKLSLSNDVALTRWVLEMGILKELPAE